MKLLFVHGGDKLKVDTENNYYTGGTYNSKVWSRYLSVFPNMTVMLRKEKGTFQKTYAEKKFQHFDKNVMNYIEMPDMNASVIDRVNPFKRKNIKQVIDEAVKKSDYVIVRMPGSGGDIAIEAAKKYKKPYLIELVGCAWDSLWQHSLKGKLLAPFSYLSVKKLAKQAPYVIYVTNEFLQKRYPTRGKSIGCSDVELPNLSKDILKRRIQKYQQTSPIKKLILGTVAPIDVRYKGQEYVIEAISKLSNENPNLDFQYHLVGDGDPDFLKSVAKKYEVEDKVIFHGSLPHEQVYEFYDNIDIYVQPSKTEGLSRAILEAMSRSCPVMGTNVGGNPELINSEWLFPVKNPGKIYSLLDEVNKEKLVEEAKRSFDKIQLYDHRLLNKKRKLFLKESIKNEFNIKIKGGRIIEDE